MEAWRQFLSRVEQELGADVVAKWTPKLIRFDAANLYLEPSDSFQIAWFEEHIRPRLKGFLNNNGRPIKVHLVTPSKDAPKRLERSSSLSPDPLDPEMTLENFVPSEKNLVIYKLLEELPPFNPIYLYGPPASGKTHLLTAVAHKLQKQNKKVFYVKAETFTEHVVQAIRTGQMQDFRRVYRDIDVLIVDGIHIFSRKNATQEEFFHTFNTLHTSGRLILLSANVAPTQLTDVEERLISRFEWGISLGLTIGDMQPILEKKASLWGMNPTAEVIQFLLDKFPSDPILPLQALLLRSKGAPLNLTIAERLLKDLLEKQQQNALTSDKIIKAVAAHYGITSEDLLGKSQMREYAMARQLAMYYCRQKLNMPYQKIGELFKRDHSTVMSSVKLIEKSGPQEIPF